MMRQRKTKSGKVGIVATAVLTSGLLLSACNKQDTAKKPDTMEQAKEDTAFLANEEMNTQTMTVMVREGQVLSQEFLFEKGGSFKSTVTKVDDKGITIDEDFELPYGKERRIGEFILSATYLAEKTEEPGVVNLTVTTKSPKPEEG